MAKSFRDKVSDGDFTNKERYFHASRPASAVEMAEAQAWRRRQAALSEDFKQGLFLELGIASHPKRHELWRLAYERGHVSGFSEILIEADDLVELLR